MRAQTEENERREREQTRQRQQDLERQRRKDEADAQARRSAAAAARASEEEAAAARARASSTEPSRKSSSSSSYSSAHTPLRTSTSLSSSSSGGSFPFAPLIISGIFGLGLASVLLSGGNSQKATTRTQTTPITTARPTPPPLPPLHDAFYVSVRNSNVELFTPVSSTYPRPVKIGTVQKHSCFASAERLFGHWSPEAYIVVYLPTESGYRDPLKTVLINKNDLRVLSDNTSSCRASYRTHPPQQVTPANPPANPKPAAQQSPATGSTRASAPPQIAAPKVTATATPAISPATPLHGKFLVTASALNLRTEPNSQSPSKGVLENGSCVTAMADAAAGFIKINTIDMTSKEIYVSGYVSADYLTPREGPDTYACRAEFTPK